MKFVFDVKESNSRKNFIQFVILSIVGLIINEIIMKMCVDKVYLNLLLSKIIATIIVMIYNFITRKILFEKWENSSSIFKILKSFYIYVIFFLNLSILYKNKWKIKKSIYENVKRRDFMK